MCCNRLCCSGLCCNRLCCSRKQDKTSCKRRPGQNGLSCGAQQIVSELESNCGGGGIVGPGALRHVALCFHAQFSTDHRGGRSTCSCGEKRLVVVEGRHRGCWNRKGIPNRAGRKEARLKRCQGSLKPDDGGEGEVVLLQSRDLGGDRRHPSGEEIGSLFSLRVNT